MCFTFPKSQKGQETCNLDPLCCKGNFHSQNIGVEAQANIGDEYFAWLLFAGNFCVEMLCLTFVCLEISGSLSCSKLLEKTTIHEESIWSHVQKCNSFALTTLEEQQN